MIKLVKYSDHMKKWFVLDNQCGLFCLLFRYVIVNDLSLLLFIFVVTDENHSTDTEKEENLGE